MSIESTPVGIDERGEADTRSADYARYLARSYRGGLGLHVQLPYQLHLRSLRLGKTLDVGCGAGRNLCSLPRGSVGIDHNRHAIDFCVSNGFSAMTPDRFDAAPEISGFDSLLIAHVVEHMTFEEACGLVARYGGRLRARARLVLITPQEAGFVTDDTHVRFSDHDDHAALIDAFDFAVVRQYSFPFARSVGRVFPFNEFVSIGVART